MWKWGFKSEVDKKKVVIIDWWYEAEDKDNK
jgi:hypothetical protein